MKGKTLSEAAKELEKAGMDHDQVIKILPHKVFESLVPSYLIRTYVFYKHSVFQSEPPICLFANP